MLMHDLASGGNGFDGAVAAALMPFADPFAVTILPPQQGRTGGRLQTPGAMQATFDIGLPVDTCSFPADLQTLGQAVDGMMKFHQGALFETLKPAFTGLGVVNVSLDRLVLVVQP